MAAPRIPLATYRLQFNSAFRFQDAIGILDYLTELGISDIYASPILTSRHGSGHGYDATDPTKIDPELGSEEDLASLQNELQRRGMGIVFDIVPNHMAASQETPWWMDVLEYGPESAYASYFDIDWHPPSRSLAGRVLLPVLEHPFGEVLDGGELQVQFDKGRLYLSYQSSRFPLAPRSYLRVLNHRMESLRDYLDPAAVAYQEYAGIVAALVALLDPSRQASLNAADRRLAFTRIQERLHDLGASSAEIGHFIEDNLRDFNGRPKIPESFGPLEQLLAEQNYKLVYWRNVNEAINYRRFFTITDLVGIRVEDPLVFEATHNTLFKALRGAVFTGLRVDHIDGLRDPYVYLTRLLDRAREAVSGNGIHDPYLVVEKILAHGEQPPVEWPVAGTTGYDYLNAANRLSVHPQKAPQIQEIYDRFVGRPRVFAEVLYETKKLVMDTVLAVEMRALSRHLAELAQGDRYAQELPRPALSEALVEVTACFPVYRTYIRNLDVPPESAELIEAAVREALSHRPGLQPCLAFLRDVFLVLAAPHVQPAQREARLGFVMRWQQFTGSIMAKSFEDTSLYIYYPLASLNEVGGDPRPDAGYADRDFFEFLVARAAHWPHSLNATTTHDTKRSEDVRARIDVLSQMPEAWQEALDRWTALNEPLKQTVSGLRVPDRNEEYLFYQTLLGTWPADGNVGAPPYVERLRSYMVKAVREAMVHTRWTRPNREHEEALTRFIGELLTTPAAQKFRAEACAFYRQMARAGMVHGLSQTLLKMVCPGVPDFYQGAELWDLHLVDPDNRGPVDFAERREQLRLLAERDRQDRAALVRDLAEHWEDGRIKLYLIWKVLAHRRAHAALFEQGSFAPVEIEGAAGGFGLCRYLEGYSDACLLAFPRWLESSPLAEAPAPGAPVVQPADAATSGTIHLEPGMPRVWKNIFTDQVVTAADSAGRATLTLQENLAQFPVALLAPV